MTRVPLVFICAVLAAPPGLAAAGAAATAHPGPAGPAGRYASPLGTVELAVDGGAVVGRLVAPAEGCPFTKGDEVLRATELDDSLAGKVHVWLSGEGCGAHEAWASVVLLVQRSSLSGAAHVTQPGCRAPLGPRGGLTLTRVDGRPPPRPAKELARAARERARALLRDGAAWLQEGNFESARKQFLAAIDVDAGLPEAYNGVGVTFRMRNDQEAALEWYKKSLAVNPDFGDAYYNMACVYALQGKKDLALRYLQIAALNGYASAEGIDEDPDLAALHDEPAYQALLKAHL
jgi:tetratricopeptide (TPR) repeat protein